jgi:aspartyl-tRNA(Asn)/glutamyl-tRNA(Gln) amidotransferase subunit A
MPLHEDDAVAIADRVRAGELRAVDVLEHHLARIARLDGTLHAFVFVDEERARRTAEDIDGRVRAGEDPGPLAGVPLAIKELEAVEGWPDTGASTAWRDHIATVTTTMSARLLAAGAVPVGLTASPEIGRLFYTTSILHGPTHNPWNTERTPGGSSGGAGAALAAGLVPLATGSDMGGSIRLPAGWCGVVGVKGTYGRVPRSPAYTGHANLVHYGPLARSVGDTARYLDCVVGVDQRDPYSLPPPPIPYEAMLREPLPAGLRVAVVDDLGIAPSDADVAEVVNDAAAALIAGTGVARVDAGLTLPNLVTLGAAILYADADPAAAEATGEIFANLLATPGARPLMELAFTDADLSLDAVARTNQMRHQVGMALAELFERADILLLPTSPVPAFGVEGPIPTVVAGRDIGPAAPALFTAPFNLSGHPVVSVPAGFVDGVPVGMQIVARRHEDALALQLAVAYERIRPWPKLASEFRADV